MEQKTKEKQKFRQLGEVAKETAKIINGSFQEMTNKMWEIGKIISEKRKEINPTYGYGFLAAIANEMENEAEPTHLGRCERFYNKFPDLSTRVDKSGLSSTHYQKLADRELTEPEIEKYEKEASEKKWSVRELTEHLPKKPEFILNEALEHYHGWANAITDIRQEFREFKKTTIKGVISQNQLNGMARTLWFFTRDDLPEMVIWLDKHDAEIDPMFKKYVEKFK